MSSKMYKKSDFSNLKICTWPVFIFNNFIKYETGKLKLGIEGVIEISTKNEHIHKFQNKTQTCLKRENTCVCYKSSWFGSHCVKFATVSLPWTKCATTLRSIHCYCMDMHRGFCQFFLFQIYITYNKGYNSKLSQFMKK
jgi:hypothetical protein